MKFQHNKNNFYQGGELVRNKMNKVPLTLDDYFLKNYDDDGLLMFSTRREDFFWVNSNIRIDD